MLAKARQCWGRPWHILKSSSALGYLGISGFFPGPPRGPAYWIQLLFQSLCIEYISRLGGPSSHSGAVQKRRKGTCATNNPIVRQAAQVGCQRASREDKRQAKGARSSFLFWRRTRRAGSFEGRCPAFAQAQSRLGNSSFCMALQPLSLVQAAYRTQGPTNASAW
jgi:hypothetical protein